MVIAFREFTRDEGFFITAGVSFYAILSLIPLAVISASLFVLSFGDPPSNIPEIIDYIKRFFPIIPEDLPHNLESFVQHSSAIGYAGTFILIWASALMFISLGKGLDKIFKLGKENILRRHIIAISLVFVVSFFLVLLVIGGNMMGAYIRGVAMKRGLSIGRKRIFSRYILPFLSYFIFTSFIYYALPHYRIKKYSAILAGICSAFVWEIGRYIFNWYILNITKVNIIYGSLSTLIIGVLWIYYSFGVLFWGAELACIFEKK